MAVLTWDNVGERTYETGLDRGVLYLPSNGVYSNGVAWSGLTTVTETPSGAESNKQYADNIPYLNLFSAEEFSATIEAYTYPKQFEQFDGMAVPQPGVTLGQQNRGVFGISYRTIFGNDVEGEAYGYKLHLIYGCQASPSERAYSTTNDSPEPINFSWELTTTPVPVTGYKPTSIITIDSTTVDSAGLAALEDLLWGTAGTDPQLPLPDTVIGLFAGVTLVTPAVPVYDNVDTITIPTVTGVDYYDATQDPTLTTVLAAGAYVIAEDTIIVARPQSGYAFTDNSDDDFFYDFP